MIIRNRLKVVIIQLIMVTTIMSNVNALGDKNFSYQPIPNYIKRKITGVSFKSYGPVSINDLSYVKVTYFGFDRKPHKGELIVNKKLAKEVCDIFKDLYRARFPMKKIRLIDDYGTNDELSMEDNNTSAFCTRPITGSKNKFSNHSYGIAIDINPLQNPYIKGKQVLPKCSKQYVDRGRVQKGMILKNGACYKIFKKRGWKWGGDWNSLKDYQHFEKVVRNKK